MGDAVYARLDQLVGGAYAEYAVVGEKIAAHKPANISYVEAAAVPLAGLTALQALRDEGQEATRYDVVFDRVGNRSFDDCKRVLQPNGYSMTTQPYPANSLQSLHTTVLPGPKYQVILLKSNAADLAFMTQQIEAGKIRSIIDCTYPLAETAEAHCHGETERTVGKVVIAIAD